MFVDRLHEVSGVAGVGAEREAAGEGFAVGGEIGDDSVEFLGPAEGETEPGDHFVEDEDDPVFAGEFAESLEEAGSRGEAAVDRFDDNRGEFVGVGGDDGRGGGEVVERGDEYVVFDPGRAGAGGIGVREIGGAAGNHAGDADGVLSVVGALELEEARAAGGGAGDAEAEHGELGAGSHEADAFGAGADRGEAFGEFDRAPVDGGEIEAIGGGAGGGFADLGMGVADEGGGPGHGEVEEFTAFGVPNPAAEPAFEDGDEVGGDAELAVGSGGEAGEGAFAPSGGVGVDARGRWRSGSWGDGGGAWRGRGCRRRGSCNGRCGGIRG